MALALALTIALSSCGSDASSIQTDAGSGDRQALNNELSDSEWLVTEMSGSFTGDASIGTGVVSFTNIDGFPSVSVVNSCGSSMASYIEWEGDGLQFVNTPAGASTDAGSDSQACDEPDDLKALFSNDGVVAEANLSPDGQELSLTHSGYRLELTRR
ncbi:MAG: hypothetical protein HKN94_14715 [Acidimicrobiales bacterium]|nr:hypothetical protein [Acidimicrobiales bacterium]RZV45378.1 MAG: hypothetical protein EX269_10060 [Acidimicrobiales bacterium]